MSDKFESLLEYLPGSHAQRIWWDLNPGPRDDLDSLASMREFVEFFSFAIERNFIIEYDVENSRPVFSGDPPQVVAERIFSDFHEKVPDLPEKNPMQYNFFVGYMFYKTGWAYLHKGTELLFPG